MIWDESIPHVTWTYLKTRLFDRISDMTFSAKIFCDTPCQNSFFDIEVDDGYGGAKPMQCWVEFTSDANDCNGAFLFESENLSEFGAFTKPLTCSQSFNNSDAMILLLQTIHNTTYLYNTCQ